VNILLSLNKRNLYRNDHNQFFKVSSDPISNKKETEINSLKSDFPIWQQNQIISTKLTILTPMHKPRIPPMFEKKLIQVCLCSVLKSITDGTSKKISTEAIS